MKVQEVQLARRPDGAPRAEDFRVADVTLPAPGVGEVLVRNALMSVDPYVRLTLDAALPLNRRLGGGGVGAVLASRDPRFREGDVVRHRQGFAEAFVAAGAALEPFPAEDGISREAQLGALGGIGMCAYGGLIGAGRMKAGETVFISSAAGAVGSIAVQVAKLKGARVVASAGSDAKCDWVRSLGADATINYRTTPIRAGLAAAAPEGVDVYFENVGGAHLEAALACMKPYGHIAVCGMISTYHDGGEKVGGLETIVVKRLTVRGFGFTDFPELDASFRNEMTAWLRSGAIRTHAAVLEGIGAAPQAFADLFQGRHMGRILVRL